MKQNYNIYQAVILILTILALNYCMLWGFHYFEIKPYPNNEIYILGLSYFAIIIVSALLIKNTSLKLIHSRLGFKRVNSKVIILALFIGTLIWISDYIYQVYFLQSNLSHEAREWITTHNNQVITFISMVILAPIIEEVLLRGILLQSLYRYMNKLLAVFIVSLAFMLLHDSYEQWPTLFIASTFYCWLTLRYKSITPSIVAHILNNALTFVLYRLLIM